MITGFMTTDREALVSVQVHGPNRHETLNAVIDTGFNGFLTLSSALIATLGCTIAGITKAELADGQMMTVEMFYVHADWDGQTQEVVAFATEGGPLLGMALLEAHRLTLEVVDGGAVRIESIR